MSGTVTSCPNCHTWRKNYPFNTIIKIKF